MRRMIAASVVSGLALLVMTGGQYVPEVTAGMVGPLVVAVITLTLASRPASNPATVQARMLVGFVVRLLFFVAYVVILVRGVGLRPVPFIATFAGYLMALYAAQIVLMRRLFLTSARTTA